MQKLSETEHITIELLVIMASELTPAQMVSLRREVAEAEEFKGDDKALNTVDAIITAAEGLRKRREIEKAQTPAPV